MPFLPTSRTEQAQLAMMLEVCASPKPGNVDRGHDYHDTWLEHFLASTIFCRPALERAEKGEGSLGMLIREATLLTGKHRGGNTHFGAFILLLPLISGGTIQEAVRIIRESTVEDAILFYDAFSHVAVRVNETDELDINDPEVSSKLKERGMTLFDVMAYSAENDMVAREWINGFSLTRVTADLLKKKENGRSAISEVFLELMQREPDTFIVKKFGHEQAKNVQNLARKVRSGDMSLTEFDTFCIDEGINPGSLADIMIAGLYIAIGEGWEWDR